jgi:murein endopeptidase
MTKLLPIVVAVPLLLVASFSFAGERAVDVSPKARTTIEARSESSSKTTVAKKSKASKRTKVRRSGSRSKVGFDLLASRGKGYYHYTGGDPADSDAWGRPETVECIERTAERWAQLYPGRPRIGIGDISRKNGGRFRPHSSHRKGVDIDIRPLKRRGEGPVSVGRSSYSRSYTRDMIALFIDTCNVKRVYFNDTTLAREMGKVSTHPGHHNHVHITLHPSKKKRPSALAGSGRRSSPAASYK